MSDAHTDGRPAESVPRATDYAALFERCPDPMVAVDCDDDPAIRAVNAAYRSTFDQYAIGDAAPLRSRHDLSGPERSVVQSAAAGNVGTDSVTKRTPQGTRTFALRAVPATGAGVTAFVRYRDVTDRQVRDQQLSVLRRVLRHDLRNDLTVVLGYARTLADSAERPEARAAAETILETAGDLRNVAESAGRLDTIAAPTEPTALGDALARLRRQFADRVPGEVAVETEHTGAPVDRRVEVALEELCRTLVEQGDATAIHAAASVEDREARVVVESDATLADQQSAALRGRAETKLRHATGISPWIARWAVRASGGTVRTRTTDDGRTRIVVSMPLLEDDTPCVQSSHYRIGD